MSFASTCPIFQTCSLQVHIIAQGQRRADVSEALLDCVKLPARQAADLEDLMKTFLCIIPRARSPSVQLDISHPSSSQLQRVRPVMLLRRCVFNFLPIASDQELVVREYLREVIAPLSEPFQAQQVRQELYFPDKRLVQFDCGKLQVCVRC